MALPNIMRRLFRNDGYGPLLRTDIVPFVTDDDLASKAADAAASTEWVKDLADAEVYVDASVASSGDGFTAAAAVKTISEGIAILQSLPLGMEHKTRLNIAAGTYDENIAFFGINTVVYISGAVTLNGRFYLNYLSNIVVSGESGSSLTINTGTSTLVGILVWGASCGIFGVPVTVTCPNSDRAIECFYGSYIAFAKAVTATVKSSAYACVLAGAFSTVRLEKGVSTTGSTDAIKAVSHGSIAINESANLSCSGAGVVAGYNSIVDISAASITISAQSGFYSTMQSFISIGDFSNLNFTRTSANGAVLLCLQSGIIRLAYPVSSNSLATFTMNSHGGGNVFYAVDHSILIIDHKFNMKITGKCGNCVFLDSGSYMWFHPNISIINSSLDGTKATVCTLSFLNTNFNGAANRFPGNGQSIDTGHFAVAI